ncbi:response regulator transcription factor [Peptoniphilus porci]|uniref:AraC family transcriptional regulator n=1 Tax=Peptoniphilus porci TaxID=2652280 RepID=A0A1U7M0D0_9FIRM|nr:response regulator transcription factor [Peptoniphilus porci]OLR65104.1 AraC family transcriptional regulator [Peptoniphilus porci]
MENNLLLYDIITKEYIHNLIYGDLSRAKLFKSTFKEYDFDLNTNYIITVMYDDFWKICRNRDNQYRYNIKKKLLDYTREILLDFKTISTTLTGTDKIIIFLDCQERDEDKAYELSEVVAEKIINGLKKYISHTVSIGISSYCKSNKDIARGYEESFSSLENIFGEGRGKILRPRAKNLSINKNYKSKIDKRIYGLLIKIGFQDKEGSYELIDMMLDEMIIRNMTEEYIKSNVIRLIVEVINYFNREHSKSNLSVITIKGIETIVDANNISDINSTLKKVVNLICSNLEREDEHELAINNAKAYVKKYYMDDINLDQIAMVVGYSKSHFSRMFKEHIGINFSKYLIKTRINNAEKLIINSDKPIYEISIDVGFNDYSYFSKVFKENYELSPKEYRNKFKTSSYSVSK